MTALLRLSIPLCSFIDDLASKLIRGLLLETRNWYLVAPMKKPDWVSRALVTGSYLL